jgi:hypothetical protein
MISFKALAAAVLLSATAATPAFAQAPVGAGGLYSKNLRDSGYNPRNDFNPNGTMRAAIQEPGLFAFYYPNLDVLNGGAPTPAARLSPDWPALKGTCASVGGGVSYCGDRCPALMISRPTHSRVIMPAAITGRDSTARYSAMRGPTAAWRAMAHGGPHQEAMAISL